MRIVGPTPAVLVVEDEPDLCQKIAESLEADGFSVAQSQTAADAFERLENYAYDGLVVDLQLPDADGLEVLDQAMWRYPDIKCIVVTGAGGVDAGAHAMTRGAIDFLIKPFQVMRPVQILKAAINERRLQMENVELRARLQ